MQSNYRLSSVILVSSGQAPPSVAHRPQCSEGSRGRGIKVESKSGDDPTPRLARPNRKPANRPAPDAPPDPALQSGQGLAS